MVNKAFPPVLEEEEPIIWPDISTSSLYQIISGSGFPNASHVSLKLSPAFFRYADRWSLVSIVRTGGATSGISPSLRPGKSLGSERKQIWYVYRLYYPGTYYGSYLYYCVLEN